MREDRGDRRTAAESQSPLGHWQADACDVNQAMDIIAANPLTLAFDGDVAGSRITALPSGPDRLAELLAIIDTAATSLSMLFYIFAKDGAGIRVRDALATAARRGIAVTVLIDSFGSAGTGDAFFLPITSAGGIVRWFGTRWTPRYLIRNHQKLVIADRTTVMAGGFNIADAYFAPPDDRTGWQDIGIIVRGPAVADAVRWFDILDGWLSTPKPRFRVLRRHVKNWTAGDGPVRWLVGGPLLRRSSWTRTLLRDLGSARSLAISTAYFSPDAAILRRIGRVGRSGGALRLVLPSRSDNGATVGASRLLYGFLLKRRADIAEFQPSLLHNKLIVADDISLVGSANLDMRSLYLNLELVLRIDDAALAGQFRALIAAQHGQSQPITQQLHRSRSGWFNRLRWLGAWFLVNALDYSVTRRLNLGLTDDQD